MFNPMNFITMRSLCEYGGISREFWDAVIVPVEASNMSCAKVVFICALPPPPLPHSLLVYHFLTRWTISWRLVWWFWKTCPH